MYKVSVIVPIYNVEKYIKKCLNSLVNQTLQEIQIILVNDGSKDKSGEIAKEYAQTYKNKILYLEKENGGLSDARNYGIPYAEGEYIAFIDSDAYIDENAYEEMYDKAKKENSDYVECDFIWEYPNKNKIDRYKEYTDLKEMFKNVRVVAWNKLIKKEIILKNNLYFPKGLRYEDVEFTYKLIPYLNKISYISKPFIHYVQRDNSIINNQNARNAEIFEVLDNVIKYYREKNIYEDYKEEIEYTYARYVLCRSFTRMCKIRDKNVKKRLLKEVWENLNTKFPKWKENRFLKEKSIKNLYMRTINYFTFKCYSCVFSIVNIEKFI